MFSCESELTSPLQPGTHSTAVASGMSVAAGALSRPMLEQLTTQDDSFCPTSVQLQLTGHGLQILLSPCGPEPHASRQQSTRSRLAKKLNLAVQTPCFLWNKVCAFPQDIAYSHLIALWDLIPLKLGRKHAKYSPFVLAFKVKTKKLRNGGKV